MVCYFKPIPTSFSLVAGKLAFLQSGGFSYLVQLFERNDITIEAKRDAAMLLRAIVHLGDERLCLFEPGVPRSKSPLEDIVNIMGTSNDPVLQLHLIWYVVHLDRLVVLFAYFDFLGLH